MLSIMTVARLCSPVASAEAAGHRHAWVEARGARGAGASAIDEAPVARVALRASSLCLEAFWVYLNLKEALQ